jgi:hypothetical protein
MTSSGFGRSGIEPDPSDPPAIAHLVRFNALSLTPIEREAVAEYRRLAGELRELHTLRPREDWDEDDGVALWWALPIEEPPYVGMPLDDDFPDHVTHWTRLAIPRPL